MAWSKTPRQRPVKVFERVSPRGHVTLATSQDERVAYPLRSSGLWLVVDDEGEGCVKNREQAERFVAGALGSTSSLRGALPVPYRIVTEAEVRQKEAAKRRSQARKDARALFIEVFGEVEVDT
jgi:hypothetical protein